MFHEKHAFTARFFDGKSGVEKAGLFTDNFHMSPNFTV
jgi:uncharacterized SAM-binding protein YcdF (DUF218 family)